MLVETTTTKNHYQIVWPFYGIDKNYLDYC